MNKYDTEKDDPLQYLSPVELAELQQAINVKAKFHSLRVAAKHLGIPYSTLQHRVKKAERMGLKPRIRVKAATTAPEETEEPAITGIVIPDAHNQPKLPRDRFYWLAAFVNEIRPDFIVDIGDFDDLGSLCVHEPNDSWRGKFKQSFQGDLEASQEAHQILSENIKVPVKKHRTLGNHEHRLWSFEDRNPEVYGMMQHAYMDMAGRHGWELTKFKDYLDIGGVEFTHVPCNRMGQPMGGKTVLSRVANESVRDIVWGHSHEMGYIELAKLGPQRSVRAFNVGCFMPEGYVPDYARGTQVSYWRGLHVIEIRAGRLHIRQSVTMKELERRYGGV